MFVLLVGQNDVDVNAFDGGKSNMNCCTPKSCVMLLLLSAFLIRSCLKVL